MCVQITVVLKNVLYLWQWNLEMVCKLLPKIPALNIEEDNKYKTYSLTADCKVLY